MRKTVWKSQNLSKNRFSQGKHHLVPAVYMVWCRGRSWLLKIQLLCYGLVKYLWSWWIDALSGLELDKWWWIRAPIEFWLIPCCSTWPAEPFSAAYISVRCRTVPVPWRLQNHENTAVCLQPTTVTVCCAALHSSWEEIKSWHWTPDCINNYYYLVGLSNPPGVRSTNFYPNRHEEFSIFIQTWS